MDFLKKELAPISGKVWEEIEERAKEILATQLSARRFVRVTGPIGKERGGVNSGRLLIKTQEGLSYGIHQVQPFVENRITFTLNRWELDNVERGAKDIDYKNLDEAVKKAAKFEERAIFNGLDEACIVGILKDEKERLEFGNTEAETIKNLMYGVSKLRNTGFTKGPYALVVSLEKFIYLNMINLNDSLAKRLEKILGMPIIVSNNISEAILVPFDDENIELILGEDFSLGYQGHDKKEIELFVTETFTFRVTDETKVITYK
ncbi:bacteriocin family protein [Cetobacterium sp. 8H]|uniref:family 1 encapsulin nanocompartment shell protein n=1 Tax=Cetobacterium sp. 8H TaxID=2759681 RepID=UPI00163C2D05|nr:family 1 encapsulin nanocompartment shell protein [Cetobacterium sp. 8H]MBC2850813.1 bacteriocin family protein [Cetobacterium sp. 8H]